MEGRTDAAGVTYVDTAPATESHPRNDSASIVQLGDGSLFMVWIEMHASRLGGHDEAPSSIASMRSADGGHTWDEHRVEQSPGGDVHSVYNPSLILLPDGELLFFYLQYCHLKWNTPLRSNGCLRRSHDGGRTWGGETRIWEQAGYGCANHTFTRLGEGRLLKSVEEAPVWGSYPQMTSRSGCFSQRRRRPHLAATGQPGGAAAARRDGEPRRGNGAGAPADGAAHPARRGVLQQPLGRRRRHLEPGAELGTLGLRVDAEPDPHSRHPATCC